MDSEERHGGEKLKTRWPAATVVGNSTGSSNSLDSKMIVDLIDQDPNWVDFILLTLGDAEIWGRGESEPSFQKWEGMG